MRRTAIISLAGLVASLGVVANDGTPAGAATTKNLILNGGGEQSTGSNNGSVVPVVPHWTRSTGMSFTVVKYGATGEGFPRATSPGPSNRKANFFAGGPNDPLDSIVRDPDGEPGRACQGDQDRWGDGHTPGLARRLGGTRTDQAFVEVDFKNKKGFLIGSSMTIGGVTESVRGGKTELVMETDSGTVPKGAQSAYVQLSFARESGQTYNDAFADTMSLKLSGV